ncbi:MULTISPECIES: hypothetical protein [unclassified Mesorhizobium]|uniref:hypothetical protein n=1 Tax=unclassified Mesorhizobium TaxID=325217 RepID=UPI0003CFE75B|nr:MULTISPECIES: hypothetical protein [unclassified Mesorhizobium]ESZ10778.1 hypothetical protein X735_27625 [Mesorhizobium sp. L2C085B000]
MAKILKLFCAAFSKSVRTASVIAVLVGFPALPALIAPAFSQDQEQDAPPNLDPDVEVLIRNNPAMFSPQTRFTASDLESYPQIYRYYLIQILALDLCEERWDDFSGQADEARRRLDLVSRAQVQVGMLSEEAMQTIVTGVGQVTNDTRVKDYLLADPNGLYSTCQQATLMFSSLNFSTQ